MEITIRTATVDDLDGIMQVFTKAKAFMRKIGNLTQWTGGYPQRELVERDICSGHCFVCVDGEKRIVGTFSLFPSPDPTYEIIYDGKWLNDKFYHVIHRLASDGSVRGIGRLCIDWCTRRCGDLRVDTHAANRVMQALVERCGFMKCGIIHTDDGTPRIAYQRVAYC